MKLFDTHCHYNLDPLNETWKEHWKTAQAAGVEKSVVVGVDLETTQQAVEIAARTKGLYAAIGIHPSRYQKLVEDGKSKSLQKYRKRHRDILEQFAQHELVVAIGETGLDYYRLPDDQPTADAVKAAQKAGLITHLKLAARMDLPLILHVRDNLTDKNRNTDNAYWDVLKVVREHYSGSKPLIFHCVSGPKIYIKEAIALGGYFGLAGNITYPNAEELRELLQIIPPNRLLLETDAPYLPPQEYRGQTCKPQMVAKTAAFLESELHLDLDQLYRNAETVFLS